MICDRGQLEKREIVIPIGTKRRSPQTRPFPCLLHEASPLPPLSDAPNQFRRSTRNAYLLHPVHGKAGLGAPRYPHIDSVLSRFSPYV